MVTINITDFNTVSDLTARMQRLADAEAKQAADMTNDTAAIAAANAGLLAALLALGNSGTTGVQLTIGSNVAPVPQPGTGALVTGSVVVTTTGTLAAGSPVSLTVTATSNSGQNVRFLVVNYGDNTPSVSVPVTSPGTNITQIISHTYADNGTYAVEVIIYDANTGLPGDILQFVVASNI